MRWFSWFQLICAIRTLTIDVNPYLNIFLSQKQRRPPLRKRPKARPRARPKLSLAIFPSPIMMRSASRRLPTHQRRMSISRRRQILPSPVPATVKASSLWHMRCSNRHLRKRKESFERAEPIPILILGSSRRSIRWKNNFKSMRKGRRKRQNPAHHHWRPHRSIPELPCYRQSRAVKSFPVLLNLNQSREIHEKS